MDKKQVFTLGYRSVAALVGWFGVIGLFYQRLINRPPEWSVFITFLDFLKYYTIQTNIFVVVWLTFAVVFWRWTAEKSLLRPMVKGAFTVYISVTFIVYALLLAKLWNPQGLDRCTAVVSHYVTPLAFILDWILFERKGTYRWNYALYWLVYPFFYFVFVQIYGGVTGEYLYPFLDLQALGLGGLAVRTAFLLIFFIALACVFIGINRMRRGGKQQSEGS